MTKFYGDCNTVIMFDEKNKTFAVCPKKDMPDGNPDIIEISQCIENYRNMNTDPIAQSIQAMQKAAAPVQPVTPAIQSAEQTTAPVWYCSYCGTKNEGTGHFCCACGAKKE